MVSFIIIMLTLSVHELEDLMIDVVWLIMVCGLSLL